MTGVQTCALPILTGDAADTAALPPVFPIKLTAGALVTAALGFFFALALDTLTDQEQQGTSAARRSARINAWASLFVLAAALLRLWDLVDSQARTAGDATLPA